MRFETLENRTLLTVGAVTAEFNFDSDDINAAEVAALNSGDLRISEFNEWYKPIVNNDPEFNAAGQLVARRTRQDTDLHTMYVARVLDTQCFGAEGLYTLPDNHYTYSFDIRFPETERSWLSDHNWSVVSQLWGPRESGEVALNPPFSIHTTSVDGQPYWAVSIRGDSRRLSTTRDYDHSELFRIPFNGGIGDWHTWDVELVIDPFGGGLMRAWLDGELVAEEVNVQTGYHAFIGGEPSGPLNPAFGLYAPLVGNQMEAHFDNISISCSSNFDRSIAGRVNSLQREPTVTAVNRGTGQRFETEASSAGVFALNVPAGIYDVSARDSVTGNQDSTRIDVRATSRIANLDLLAGSCRESDGTTRFGGNCDPQTTPEPEPQTPSTQTPDQPSDVPDGCYEADGTRFFGGSCADIPTPEPEPEPQPEPEPEPQPETPSQPQGSDDDCVEADGTRLFSGDCGVTVPDVSQPTTPTPDEDAAEDPASDEDVLLDDCVEADGTRFFGGDCVDGGDPQPDSEPEPVSEPVEEVRPSGRVRRRPPTLEVVLAVNAVFTDSDENWLDESAL